MLRNIAYPSEAVAKRMLSAGSIGRVKLTARDIDNAVDIEARAWDFFEESQLGSSR